MKISPAMTMTMKPPWPIPKPQTPILLSLPHHSHQSQSQNPQIQPHQDAGLLFRQKLLYLQHHLGVDSRKALALNPAIRAAPISSVKSVASCLASMGLDRAAASRVLDMHPSILTTDPHGDLYPVLDFLLHDAALPFPDARRAIIRCPRLLLCPVDSQLRPALAFLCSLGFTGFTSYTTLLLVSSVDRTLRPKLEFLRLSLRLSAKEVAAMAVRAPGILTLSVEKNLKPKVEFFIHEMAGDAADLWSFPQFFSFSLERKIRPRHRALKEVGLVVPLPEMLKISDGEFAARLLDMRLRRLNDRR